MELRAQYMNRCQIRNGIIQDEVHKQRKPQILAHGIAIETSLREAAYLLLIDLAAWVTATSALL